MSEVTALGSEIVLRTKKEAVHEKLCTRKSMRSMLARGMDELSTAANCVGAVLHVRSFSDLEKLTKSRSTSTQFALTLVFAPRSQGNHNTSQAGDTLGLQAIGCKVCGKITDLRNGSDPKSGTLHNNQQTFYNL